MRDKGDTVRSSRGWHTANPSAFGAIHEDTVLGQHIQMPIGGVDGDHRVVGRIVDPEEAGK